jgi:DNA modification methylase
MTYKVIQGNNINVLKTYPDNHFDSIVTDPPYGIDFLGKSWDANTGALETYQECLRVLKPGGHILAFSAARTYHHLAITLEQAGFEIRDQIMWIYSSGFPKSQDIGKSIDRAAGKKDPNYQANNFNATSTEGKGAQGQTCVKCNITLVKDVDPTKSTVGKCKEEECAQKYTYQTDEGKQWAGWGTQLKPAHEPICMARKPLKQSIAQNCQEWGVGALNIDATRVETTDVIQSHYNRNSGAPEYQGQKKNIVDVDLTTSDKGRFPSNVLGEIQEEYQKYFYCPKVSSKERHIGLENPGPQTARARDADGNVLNYAEKKAGASANVLVEQFQLSDKGNNHPTVKPIELMKYLILLITPPGGKVLDPFNGSGSTGCAAVELGFDYTGIDLDANYVDISLKRIEAWTRDIEHFNNLFQEL